MRITTKGRYALRAMLHILRQEDDKPVSIKSIADGENLSPVFLEQIFTKLKKAGLIRSIRGAMGGFQLEMPPDRITVLDILSAVGEDVVLTPCCSEQDEAPCAFLGRCVSQAFWNEANSYIRDYFEGITLQGLLDKYADKVLERV